MYKGVNVSTSVVLLLILLIVKNLVVTPGFIGVSLPGAMYRPLMAPFLVENCYLFLILTKHLQRIKFTIFFKLPIML